MARIISIKRLKVHVMPSVGDTWRFPRVKLRPNGVVVGYAAVVDKWFKTPTGSGCWNKVGDTI